ncbi:hypothetical protein [Thiolinea disciformis]|uniref:hypothetical protein n=1 Tax=Thiolinea disciformis TaxID=125614 RepID=UPI00036A1243|nr:hypothetical protein [Thiolinea disciformis]
MKLLILFAIVLLGIFLSTIIWHFLIRSTPTQQQTGIIKNIQFASRETVKRTEIRSIRHPDHLTRDTQYIIPDRYIYTIQLPDGRLAYYSENASDQKIPPTYQLNENVQVSYQLRVIPFYKEKLTILNITR